MTGAPVAIALLHYPVYDRNRRTVVSAITNLDIHDIARAAKTFGLSRYFLVTPAVEQQLLARQIIGHWQEGYGATYNPKRKAALDLVTVAGSLEDAIRAVEAEHGSPPRLVATGASAEYTIGYEELRTRLFESERPHLLLFGTGWGLTEEVMARADDILPPVQGPGGYNHLSVRSAVAIIFDRLFGRHLQPTTSRFGTIKEEVRHEQD
jgi:hypothetical protein